MSTVNCNIPVIPQLSNGSGQSYINADEMIRKDRDTVLAIVRVVPDAFRIIGLEFRDDEEIVRAAVQISGKALAFASDRLRSERSIVLDAVRNDADALACANPDIHIDHQMLVAAIKCNTQVINLLDERTIQIPIIATAVVEAMPHMISRFTSQNNYRDLVLIAVSKDGDVIQNVLSEDLRNDMEIVLAALMNGSRAVSYLNRTLRDNESVMRVAVNKSGWYAFQYASDRLRNDNSFAMFAIQRDCVAIHDVSERLKNDRDFVLAAVQVNGKILEFLSERFKHDEEIVRAAAR